MKKAFASICLVSLCLCSLSTPAAALTPPENLSPSGPDCQSSGAQGRVLLSWAPVADHDYKVRACAPSASGCDTLLVWTDWLTQSEYHLDVVYGQTVRWFVKARQDSDVSAAVSAEFTVCQPEIEVTSMGVRTWQAVGRRYGANFTVENTGPYLLRTSDYEMQPASVDTTNLGAQNLPLQQAVAPGQTLGFMFHLEATSAGSYDARWRLRRLQAEQYGEPVRARVVVEDPLASCGGALVYDTLLDTRSVLDSQSDLGTRFEGAWKSDGWQAEPEQSRLQYDFAQACTEGSLSFTVVGLHQQDIRKDHLVMFDEIVDDTDGYHDKATLKFYGTLIPERVGQFKLEYFRSDGQTERGAWSGEFNQDVHWDPNIPRRFDLSWGGGHFIVSATFNDGVSAEPTVYHLDVNYSDYHGGELAVRQVTLPGAEDPGDWPTHLIYSDIRLCCRTGCVPDCSGRQCGANGCGGTCGSCSGGAICSEHGTCITDAGFVDTGFVDVDTGAADARAVDAAVARGDAEVADVAALPDTVAVDSDNADSTVPDVASQDLTGMDTRGLDIPEQSADGGHLDDKRDPVQVSGGCACRADSNGQYSGWGCLMALIFFTAGLRRACFRRQ